MFSRVPHADRNHTLAPVPRVSEPTSLREFTSGELQERAAMKRADRMSDSASASLSFDVLS